MWKRLAILIVILTSIWGVEPIPGQTTHGNGSGGHSPEKQTSGSNAPAAPTITLIEKNCNSDQFKNDGDCKAAEEKETTITVSKFPTANVAIQRTPVRDKYDWLAYWAG